ncbi:MAG: hypothetical protein KME32_05350 [Mojavia pulchra JT2-VF2]|uniref:Uncharacterized protein n=1 Tax=Mojavia pulchra JT2-VF2 TaxID=287848 RepID=A0A951PVD9_9NOST|nr:hypothetical protein [Mojavia pulchra JT2-VF2]
MTAVATLREATLRVSTSRGTLSAVPPGGNPQGRTASPTHCLPNAQCSLALSEAEGIPHAQCPMPHTQSPIPYVSKPRTVD